MTREEKRELIGQFAAVSGWLCLGLAVVLGVGLFLIAATRSKGGGPVAAYEVSLLLTIPVLIFLSAPLMLLARVTRRVRFSLAYWSVVGVAMIPWLMALMDFMTLGGEHGFQEALRTFGFK
jgi:hypothetical protein